MSYLAARAGSTIVIRPQLDWPLWPGNILLVSVLLFLPAGLWPITIAAALTTFASYDLSIGLPVRSILLFQTANAVETLTAALGLRYSFGGLPKFDSVKALAKYSLFSMFIAPLFGVSIGALATSGEYWESWRIDFLSGALGYLALLPAILGWINEGAEELRASRIRRLEATSLLIYSLVLGYFGLIWTSTIVAPMLSLVPLLLWAALRFGTTGVSTVTTIAAALAIWGAVHGRGPFLSPQVVHNMPSIQLFLLLLTAPFMLLAVVLEEHKQSQRALRESEKRFHAMADTAPSLIWMCDKEGKITYLNDRYLAFTGADYGDDHGRSLASIVHPEDLQKVLDVLARAVNSRESFSTEYRLRRRDGVYRWIFDAASPRISGDGSFAGFVGSAIDITDQKLAREALETFSGRLIEAQEKERARIARDLHDDICQRLAVLSMEIQRANRVRGEYNEPNKEELEKIRVNCAEIAGDVQLLSHELHSSKLDTLGIAAAVRGLCREFGKQHEVTIEFSEQNVPKDLSREVSLCLFRVTQEALHNAVKYSGTNRFQVELTGSTNRIRLAVQDNGMGFDVETAKKNRGLGLVSMQERMNLIRGQLDIKSSPGMGTTIVALVPLHLEDSASLSEIKGTNSKDATSIATEERSSLEPCFSSKRGPFPAVTRRPGFGLSDNPYTRYGAPAATL